MVVATENPSDDGWWIVKLPHDSNESDTTRAPVKNGDKIRLEHLLTRKNLHSHDSNTYKSPITRQQEVTAFGSFGWGNPDDDWTLELLAGDQVDVAARIVLHHVPTGAVLHSHGGQSHKEFTDGEQEVTCLKRGDDNDFWEIAEVNLAPERSVGPLLDLGVEGRFGPINFYSLGEFSRWFEAEDAAWNWLTREGGVEHVFDLRNRLFSEIRNNLRTAMDQRDGDNIRRLVDIVRSSANTAFRDSQWPVSSEAKAKFILAVAAKKSKKIAVAALACLIGREIPPGREHVEGAFIAFAFEAGLAGVAESELESFRGLRKTIEDDAKLIQAERAELNSRGAELLGQFANDSKTLADAFGAKREELLASSTARFQKQADDWEKTRGDAEKRLHDFEETLRNKIAVEASVTYWKRKGRYNFALACVFALAGFAAGLGLYLFLTDISATLLNADKLGIHDYWRFAILVFTATIAIWLGRLLVQLVFSNLHQWTDARERQTMIQTYLALKKDGYLPDGKDVSLVLGVLFRPSDSGLLKGERGPATPAELVVKRFDRGTGEGLLR